MAANWQKLLFSGSAIEVAQISASNIPHTSSTAPELSVITIDENTGKVNFVSQSILQVQNGDTTFGISGSSTGNGVNFESSGSRLLITSNNPDYLAVSVSGSTNKTTVSFDPSDTFKTGSGQFNAINYSVSAFGFVSPAGSPSDFRTAFYNPIVGFSLSTGFVNSPAAVGSILHNTNALGASNTPASTVLNQNANKILHKVIFGGPYTGSAKNLWINPFATTNPSDSSPTIDTLNPNPALNSYKKNYYWLSASLLGGFTVDSIPSLSASLSTFTGSIETNSSSIGNLQTASQDLTDATSSMALNSYTSSFLTSLVPKSVNSLFHGGTQIDQVTILDDSYSGGDFTVDSQGRKIQIGAIAPAASPLSNYPNARHLTIEGDFTASNIALAGDGVVFQEIEVASLAGSATYGTSSLHTHEFIGNVFVTGSVDVEGPVSIATSLPTEDDNVTVDNPVQILVKSGANNTLKFTTINADNSTIDGEIESTADAVSSSFLDRIATIQSAIDSAPGDASNIDLLESGYGVLTSSISKGFYIATASGIDTGIEGFTQLLGTHTSSFSSSVGITNTDHTLNTEIFKVSHSLVGTSTTINFRFNTASFIDSTNIITASQEIQTTVNNLNRYGKLSQLILTSSTDTANITYIANLAEDLPSGTGEQFLSGTNQPWGEVVNLPSGQQALFDDFSSTTQGQIIFTSTQYPGNSYPAFFVDLANTNDATFAGLTVGDGSADSGEIVVKGSLIQIAHSNLNIKDQFILINSGTLPGGDIDAVSANDPDGGIIVGNGSNSGSIFMFDDSHNRWGFIGANGTDVEALDVESNNDNTLTPDIGVRVAAYRSSLFNTDGTPKDVSNFAYGNSTQNTQLGIMAICADADINPDGDVYIYA